MKKLNLCKNKIHENSKKNSVNAGDLLVLQENISDFGLKKGDLGIVLAYEPDFIAPKRSKVYIFFPFGDKYRGMTGYYLKSWASNFDSSKNIFYFDISRFETQQGD